MPHTVARAQRFAHRSCGPALRPPDVGGSGRCGHRGFAPLLRPAGARHGLRQRRDPAAHPAGTRSQHAGSASTWSRRGRGGQRAGHGLPARFEVRDAATVEGRFDAAINIGASHAHGGFPAALRRFRAWRRRHIRRGVLAHPVRGLLYALGGATVDELSDLDGLRAAVRAIGFDIVDEWCASEEDWAGYEETLAANAERHDTPDTAPTPTGSVNDAPCPTSTNTLGFALLVLRA